MHKYPRTYHMPFSEGATNDDRICSPEWFDVYLKNKTLVLTEKLDGECVGICQEGAYTRSVAAPTSHPWSHNIWGVGGVYETIKPYIGKDEIIYGENLYGIHSIEYNNLPSFYHVYGIRDENRWYAVDEVLDMVSICGLPVVPILGAHQYKSVEELQDSILHCMESGSRYGETIEGIVVRNINSFPIDEFSHNVVKYVRKNHVQTDQFWQRNWKKAKLHYDY